MGKAKPKAPEQVSVPYDLLNLPTAQHRAGLAGLLLQIRHMEGKNPRPKAIPEITDETATSATIVFNAESTQCLFDDLYSATVTGEWFRQKKAKEELRGERTIEIGRKKIKEYRYGDTWLTEKTADKPDEVRTIETGGTKVKEYLYDATRPQLPAVRQYLGDSGAGVLWIKLWQDMVWGVPRGVNTTRVPFEVVGGWDRKKPKDERRVAKRPCPEGAIAWAALCAWQTAKDKQKATPVSTLDGKFWLGAQKENAELIGFQGFVHLNLLLHFWLNSVLIFVPQTFKADRKNNKLVAKRRYDGFTLTIPDVSDLKRFQARFRMVLSTLGRERAPAFGRPPSAVIEVAAEGALSLVDRDLVAGVTMEQVSGGSLRPSIAGVDYFHFRPGKNGPRMLSAGRLALRDGLAREYREIVGAPGERPPYRNPLFRRGLILSLLAQNKSKWHQPFAKLFTEWPADFFVCTPASPAKMAWFWADARKKLYLLEKAVADTPETADVDALVGTIVLRIVRGYLDERVLAATGQDPRAFRKEKKKQTQPMLDARKRYAQDVFMQFRSRREEDFVALFRDKLLPCGHWLKDEDLLRLHHALSHQIESVKTLAMLALSANSYVPSSKSTQEAGK